MYIESIRPCAYGPFSSMPLLELDKEVTVLTGPNDVGKSSMLRLIHRSLSGFGDKTTEDELNVDSLHDSGTNWDIREGFGAAIRLRPLTTDNLTPFRNNPMPNGFDAWIGIAPKKKTRHVVGLLLDDKVTQKGSWSFPEDLSSLLLPHRLEVRNTITFQEPTDLEVNLFRMALGRQFTFSTLASSSALSIERQLTRAEATLNQRLADLLSSSLGLQWRLRPAEGKTGIHCFLTDKQGALTPLGMRGAGIRKVVSILAALMSQDLSQGSWVVLYDEPEACLHADSQHLLRKTLETLARASNIQVVYATHSPSMINVMRPESVRLLSRTTHNEIAATIIDNRPFKQSYYPVRASLGITPADSLLYAPLTIVVEGDTEVVALPLLLIKLAAADTPGFADVSQLLSQSHFLDGMGDQFGYVVKLAKSQGAHVVLFVDGDKRKRVAQHDIGDTPAVILPNNDEFEQLVPKETYFQAVLETMDEPHPNVSTHAYETWNASASLPDQMAFTKRVGRWLDSLDVLEPNKARIMRRAVELVDASKVNAQPLLELVKYIRQGLP